MSSTVGIRLSDKNANATSMNMHFPTARTIPEIEGFLAVNLPLLDAAIGSIITGVIINYSYDTGALGLKGSPVGLSLGHKAGGLWGVNCADNSKHSIFVPSVIDSNVNGNVVSGTEINAWRDHMLAGETVSAQLVKPSNRDDDEISSTRYFRTESRT